MRSLSDLVGGLELSAYPQVALVIFLGVFVLVLLRVFARSRKAEYERAATIPLEDAPVDPRDVSKSPRGAGRPAGDAEVKR